MAAPVLIVVTPPASEPITLAECRRQCDITAGDTTHDTELTRLITAARMSAERWLHRTLINTTYDWKLDRLPYGDASLAMPSPPLSSVTSITYVDADGVSQTLGASVYNVSTHREPGLLRVKYGQQWPTVRVQPEAVTIRFVAGYGSAASYVPELLRHSLLLLVRAWFLTPDESPDASPPRAVRAIWDQYAVGDEWHCYEPSAAN